MSAPSGSLASLSEQLADAVAQFHRRCALANQSLFLRRIDAGRILEVDEAVDAVGVDEFHGDLHPDRERLVATHDTSLRRAVGELHISPALRHTSDFGIECLADARTQLVRRCFLAPAPRQLS